MDGRILVYIIFLKERRRHAMRNKKFVAAVTAGMLMAALAAFPAAAHGHGHCGRGRAVAEDTSCPVCTVEGCTETGRHTHDGHDYCGYDHGSGYCDRSCENVNTSSGYSGHHRCHG